MLHYPARFSQDIPLCTLLEDSRIQSSDHPLHLAATLIETLVEHFGHSMTAETPARAGSGKLASSVISLHDAYPLRRYQSLLLPRLRCRSKGSSMDIVPLTAPCFWEGLRLALRANRFLSFYSLRFALVQRQISLV